ncbi:M12 family metallopeptidase [Gemmata sp. SH-PL17]|uniref:M12 family metallopeptidase n=1 Tax=Gemmata sp. SH-PL17 TaxID=1630693 RepID=UPI0009EE8BAA|nr:M12 family metallopeptidase [Gemmata sp. SH-PL17]
MVAAAARAVEHNPANAPPPGALASLIGIALVGEEAHRWAISVVTSKYWGTGGRKFGVQFLDNPNQATRTKILAHMNAWNSRCSVSFQESAQGEIRITRGGTGYWSYLGTDILSIPSNQATMNLQGFTENTPDSEYRRVVRHETGHSLGCPHEHMRRAIVDLLDVNKTINYFAQTQGWSANETRQQVLTAIEERSLLASSTTDQDSVMCYQLPAGITKNGKPIVGGVDITENDFAFMSKLYPKPQDPPPAPPPPPVASGTISFNALVSDVINKLQALGYTVTK